MLDEAEAVEYASDLMSYVYGETAERWASKGKGKGKRPKGKGKGKGKDLNPAKGAGKNNKGFGIHGTGTGNYADHRRALQEARTNRGFAGTRGPGRIPAPTNIPPGPEESQPVPPVPSDWALEPGLPATSPSPVVAEHQAEFSWSGARQGQQWALREHVLHDGAGP